MSYDKTVSGGLFTVNLTARYDIDSTIPVSQIFLAALGTNTDALTINRTVIFFSGISYY